MTPTRRQIRAAILELLTERGTSTSCPSEVARKLSTTDWRKLMAPVREVAAQLQEQGLVDAYQRGAPVKAASVRGPIRLRAREVSRIDYRAEPHRYRVGKGEMGVLTVEPYKSELLPLWRFATPAAAQKSSRALYAKFREYQRAQDFVGMDMARKFLQMGWTRAALRESPDRPEVRARHAARDRGRGPGRGEGPVRRDLQRGVRPRPHRRRVPRGETAAPRTLNGGMKPPMKTLGAIGALLLGLFVVFNFAYRAGADGLVVGGGGDVSFNRGHDRQLLRVSDSMAVLVDQSGSNELPVVDVTRAPFPFTILCGTFEPDGFTRNVEEARAKFGEKLSVKPHPVQGERDRVLVAMTVQEAAKALPPMSTCNESCLTFNAAFVVLFALLALVAPVAWWRTKSG